MHKDQLIYQWYLVLRHIVKNTDVSFCVEFVLEVKNKTKKKQPSKANRLWNNWRYVWFLNTHNKMLHRWSRSVIIKLNEVYK